MIRSISFILVLLISGYVSVLAQINKYGYPLTTNYDVDVFKESPQYWSVAQDSRGVMYFANIEGVAEYDGSTWREIAACEVETGFVASDADGVVFVGGYNDFGYLAPDSLGEVRYVSLRNTLDDEEEFSVIDKGIEFSGDKVFFSGKGVVIVYDKKTNKSTRWKIDPRQRVAISDGHCLFNNNGVLSEVTEDTVVALVDVNQRLNVADFAKVRENEYLVSFFTKLYSYNAAKRELSPIKSDLFTSLMEKEDGRIGWIEPLGNGQFVALNTIETQSLGFTCFDEEYNLTEIMSRQNGLLGNQIFGGGLANDDIFWLTQWGISKTELKSPFRHFGIKSGLSSNIIDFTQVDGIVYVAAAEGVFKMSHDEKGMTCFEKLKGYETGMVHNVVKYNNPYTHVSTILVASSNGLFEVVGSRLKRLNHQTVRAVFHSDKDPYHLYFGYHDIVKCRIYPDSIHEERCFPNALNGTSTRFAEDEDGKIWYSSYSKGVGYIHGDSITVIKSKSNQIQDIRRIDGHTFFLDGEKVFEYNERGKMLVESSFVDSLSSIGGGYVSNFFKYGDGYFCNIEGRGWGILEVKGPNKGAFHDLFIKRLYSEIRNIDWECLQIDSTLWFHEYFNVYTYTTDTENFSKLRKDNEKCSRGYNALVRMVAASDSVIFKGCFFDDKWNSSITQREDFVPHLEYGHNELSFTYSAAFYESEEKTLFSYCLEGYSQSWSEWSTRKETRFTNIFEGTYTFKVKAKNIYGVESSVSEFTFVVNPPFYRTWWAYFIYFLLVVFLFVFLSIMSVKLYTRRLQAENDRLDLAVKERTEEIESQKKKIEAQRNEILNSVNYAAFIQCAALTPSEQVDAIFPENFIIYKPCSIVSGDFYWIGQVDDKSVCVVGDCTGHGVPGGFMSMLGMSFLSDIIGKETNPAEILQQLRKRVKANLHQTGDFGVSQDGMDISVCVIDERTKHMVYAGAYNSVVIVRNGEMYELKADKMPIGVHPRDKNSFTNKEFDLCSGDFVYSFTDGYADQHGGEILSRYSMQRFKERLTELSALSMEEQKKELLRDLSEHQGAYPQTDDILVVGFRVS